MIRVLLCSVFAAFCVTHNATAQNSKPGAQVVDPSLIDGNSAKKAEPTPQKSTAVIRPEAKAEDGHAFSHQYLDAKFSSLRVLKSGIVEVTFDVTGKPQPGYAFGVSLSQDRNGTVNTSLEDHWRSVRATLQTSEGDEFAPIDARGIWFNNANMNSSRIMAIKSDGDGSTPITIRFRPTTGRVNANATFTLETTLNVHVAMDNVPGTVSHTTVNIRLSDLRAK